MNLRMREREVVLRCIEKQHLDATILDSLSRYVLLYKARELSDVFFCRIERAHPANHGGLLVPDVKEVMLLDSSDRFAWNFHEDTICLDRVSDL